MKKVLFCILAGAALGGCAATNTSAPNNDAKEEAVYRTGSNIPTKQKAGDTNEVKAYDKEAAEKIQRDSIPAMRPSSPGGKPGG